MESDAKKYKGRDGFQHLLAFYTNLKEVNSVSKILIITKKVIHGGKASMECSVTVGQQYNTVSMQPVYAAWLRYCSTAANCSDQFITKFQCIQIWAGAGGHWGQS